MRWRPSCSPPWWSDFSTAKCQDRILLFNSYEFILAFLPVTLVVFYWIGSSGRTQLALG